MVKFRPAGEPWPIGVVAHRYIAGDRPVDEQARGFPPVVRMRCQECDRPEDSVVHRKGRAAR